MTSPQRQKLRLQVLFVVVILVGIIAAKASVDARHAAADTRRVSIENRELIIRLDAQTKSLAAAQITLARQAQYLCVKLKKGRIVVKQILDELGNPIATRVGLVSCPIPKHP